MAQPKWPPTTPDSLAPANILDDGTIEIRAGYVLKLGCAISKMQGNITLPSTLTDPY